MNCDGLVNFADINPFVLALTNPAQYQIKHPGCPIENADINRDGLVGFADINPFVAWLVNSAPYVDEYWDSGCLPERGGQGMACEEDDQITYTVGSHMVHVLHSNAEYNCCPDDIVISLTVEGNVLHFAEEEVLSTPCFCICCYDVEATVVNLPSGTYVAEFCWYDYGFGDRCDVQEIVIP